VETVSGKMSDVGPQLSVNTAALDVALPGLVTTIAADPVPLSPLGWYVVVTVWVPA
jgi:hypothetical protein